MRIKEVEHVYVVDGTEQEVRELKQKLYEKYEEVSVYPTPFDDRIVCKLGNCVRCIEPYEDEETGEEREGEKVPAFCSECRVCIECEHLSECSESQ